VILAEHFHITPEFTELASPEADDSCAHARLLIGGKVVRQAGDAYPHQLDLGEAWKALTGLPFVFAAWMARHGVELGTLPARLEQAKREGLANVDAIVQRHATDLGWPADLARSYPVGNMLSDLGPRQLEA